jgi:hypothetical protein
VGHLHCSACDLDLRATGVLRDTMRFALFAKWDKRESGSARA